MQGAPDFGNMVGGRAEVTALPRSRASRDSMPQQHPNDPLHGITLEAMLTQLVARYGWPHLAEAIQIRCFMFDPTISSSLKFLRRTPWARAKVEALYRDSLAAPRA